MTGKTLNTGTAVAADAGRDTEMTAPKITREEIEALFELADAAEASNVPIPPWYEKEDIVATWHEVESREDAAFIAAAKPAAIKALCTLALQAEAMQPRPLRELTSRVAVIERLGRDPNGSYHIIVHKHPDGRWREAGAHMSCGHFDDNEPGIPLNSLPEPRS